MMHDKPKSFRYMWLLPLVMMALAMLACDDIAYPPPTIDRIEAQPDKAGQAFARVINVGLSYQSSDPKNAQTVTYETIDYGVTWHRAEHIFAETAHNSYTFDMYGETLRLNDRPIWSFPRPVFRSVFYDGTSQDAENQFALPYSNISNSAAGETVYISMGNQGVLVGKLDANGIAPGWTLSARGIDTLKPLPLTITNPIDILYILLLILVVPPFALIHAYLLQRVWVYVLPALEARQMALRVTAGLVVVAVIGAVIWLTSDRIDLYQVVAVVTAIVAIVGVTVTVLLAQKANVTDSTRNRLVIAALIVSLIVPGGVAAIFAVWWLVFGVVFCYWAYQRVYVYYLGAQPPTAEGRQIRWWADRLTIETSAIPILFVLMLGILLYGGTLTIDSIRWRPLNNVLIFPAGIVAVIVFFTSLRAYANRRVVPFLQAHTEATPAMDIHTPSHSLMWRMTRSTIFWLVLTIAATVATFAGQAMAYGWFTSLLKAKPIP